MSQATFTKRRPKSTAARVADSFSKSVVLISFLMILQRAIGFARSFFVCGVLSPTEVGQWDLAFNFLMLAAPLAVLGIPGSFGRYLSRYEELGQQNRLLKHSVSACLLLTALACSLIVLLRRSISIGFFGDASQQSLVVLLAIGLPAVVFFNFATSWLTGKRLNRFVFRIQFSQTLFFALLCVVLFHFYEASAVSVVIGYLTSCAFGVVLGVTYVSTAGDEPTETTGDTSESGEAADCGVARERGAPTAAPIWPVVLPFAVWVWVSDLLENLFTLCDRLLLVNFHPAGGESVQALIGQYHTACLFPFLLMTFGAMVASTGLPYLSKDWESGNHDAVSRRMNLMLVALGVVCLVASVGILLIAPTLFGQLWKDKFEIGESLLPMTLCYCSLAALSFVGQNYFWCIERARISTTMLLIGLVVNAALGLMLVRRFGIDGVVASTLASHAIVLGGILIMGRRHGMQIDRGVILISAALVLVSFGTWPAVASLVVTALLTLYTPLIFGDEEKREFARRSEHLLSRWVRRP